MAVTSDEDQAFPVQDNPHDDNFNENYNKRKHNKRMKHRKKKHVQSNARSNIPSSITNETDPTKPPIIKQLETPSDQHFCLSLNSKSCFTIVIINNLFLIQIKFHQRQFETIKLLMVFVY